MATPVRTLNCPIDGVYRIDKVVCFERFGDVRLAFVASHPLGTIGCMKKKLHSANSACPCGNDTAYAVCCGAFHRAVLDDQPIDTHASTPEELMRSRYCAYVLGLIDYLLSTWHPSTAPGELELSPVKWLGLEVLHAQATGDAGVVEFVARCSVGGRAQRMHEISRFVREAGRWYYIDGQICER